jgi:hypothetical protein
MIRFRDKAILSEQQFYRSQRGSRTAVRPLRLRPGGTRTPVSGTALVSFKHNVFACADGNCLLLTLNAAKSMPLLEHPGQDFDCFADFFQFFMAKVVQV